jgi:hypothetical protein
MLLGLGGRTRSAFALILLGDDYLLGSLRLSIQRALFSRISAAHQLHALPLEDIAPYLNWHLARAIDPSARSSPPPPLISSPKPAKATREPSTSSPRRHGSHPLGLAHPTSNTPQAIPPQTSRTSPLPHTPSRPRSLPQDIFLTKEESPVTSHFSSPYPTLRTPSEAFKKLPRHPSKRPSESPRSFTKPHTQTPSKTLPQTLYQAPPPSSHTRLLPKTPFQNPTKEPSQTIPTNTIRTFPKTLPKTLPKTFPKKGFTHPSNPLPEELPNTPSTPFQTQNQTSQPPNFAEINVFPVYTRGVKNQSPHPSWSYKKGKKSPFPNFLVLQEGEKITLPNSLVLQEG